jgi:hypothetical protein
MDLAGLMGGAVLMGLAAFTPFVLLRLLPILEVAVAAQGISRSPVRAAQAGMQGAYYLQGLDRIAGAGSRGPAGTGTAGAGGPGVGEGPAGPAGSAGPGAGAGAGPARAAPAGGAAGAGAGGGAAAVAPVAAVAVPVGAAAATARAVRSTAEQAASTTGGTGS